MKSNGLPNWRTTRTGGGSGRTTEREIKMDGEDGRRGVNRNTNKGIGGIHARGRRFDMEGLTGETVTSGLKSRWREGRCEGRRGKAGEEALADCRRLRSN